MATNKHACHLDDVSDRSQLKKNSTFEQHSHDISQGSMTTEMGNATVPQSLQSTNEHTDEHHQGIGEDIIEFNTTANGHKRQLHCHASPQDLKPVNVGKIDISQSQLQPTAARAFKHPSEYCENFFETKAATKGSRLEHHHLVTHISVGRSGAQNYPPHSQSQHLSVVKSTPNRTHDDSHVLPKMNFYNPTIKAKPIPRVAEHHDECATNPRSSKTSTVTGRTTGKRLRADDDDDDDDDDVALETSSKRPRADFSYQERLGTHKDHSLTHSAPVSFTKHTNVSTDASAENRNHPPAQSRATMHDQATSHLTTPSQTMGRADAPQSPTPDYTKNVKEYFSETSDLPPTRSAATKHARAAQPPVVSSKSARRTDTSLSQPQHPSTSSNKRPREDHSEDNRVQVTGPSMKRARCGPYSVVTSRDINYVAPSRRNPAVASPIQGSARCKKECTHKKIYMPVMKRLVQKDGDEQTKYTVYQSAEIAFPFTEFVEDGKHTYFLQPDADPKNDSEEQGPTLLTSETIHDVAVQGIEAPNPHGNVGMDQYNQLLAFAVKEISEKQVSGPTEMESKTKECGVKNGPTFRPRDENFDFSKIPFRRDLNKHQNPAFKGVTCNPLTALAIIRIAERNLPFVDLSSALDHLPFADPTKPYPQWRDDFETVAEAEPEHGRLAVDLSIRVVFLHHYYADNRHAIGFYNKRLGTGRLGTAVFTPCTTDDLRDAKLLRRVNAPDADRGEVWEDLMIGCRVGEWYHPDVVEDYESWRALTDYEYAHRVRLALACREVEEADVMPYDPASKTWLDGSDERD